MADNYTNPNKVTGIQAAIKTTTSPLTPGGGASGDEMKHKLGAGAANLLIVNNFALALQQVSISPPSTPPPAWYNTLAHQLDTAKGHANNWLSIADEIGAVIPATVIEYGSEFQAAAELILQQIEVAQGSEPGSKAYKKAIKTILTYLGALQSKLGSIHTSVSDAAFKLHTAQVNAAADFEAFTNGVGSIQKAKAHLEDLIGEINIDIHILHAKIDSENKLLTDSIIGLGVGLLALVAGIALAIVSGGTLSGLVVVGGGLVTAGGVAGITATEVLMKQQSAEIIKKTAMLKNDERQIAVLGGLNATLDSLMKHSRDAQSAMSTIAVMWTAIDKVLSDLINNVNKTLTHPKDHPLEDILNPLAIATAAQEWKALVELVANFQTKPQTTTTEISGANAAA